MSCKCHFTLSSVSIPQDNRPIHTPTRNSNSIWTERYTIDVICMPLQGGFEGPGINIP